MIYVIYDQDLVCEHAKYSYVSSDYEHNIGGGLACDETTSQ